MQTFFLGPGTLSDLALGEGRICDGIVNWLESVANSDDIIVKVVAGTFCHLLDAIDLMLDSVDDQETRCGYDSLKSNLHRDFEDFSKAGLIVQLDDELEKETIRTFPLTAMVKPHITGQERFWDASYRYTAAAAAREHTNRQGNTTVIVDRADSKMIYDKLSAKFGIKFVEVVDL